MSRKLAVIVVIMLTAALAEAQPRTAPKTPPRPPRPAAPAVAPAIVDVPDMDLDIELGPLADLDLHLAPMLDLAVRPAVAAAAEASAALARELGDVDVWQEVAFRGGDDYARGTEYLDQGRYEQALKSFEKAVAANGKKADGALYWKAYCLNRLGRGSEALATLDELLKKFPSSHWANDAKALQVEVRQASGRPVNPAQESDDELKMLALNGLVMHDPDRGIPMVEQILTSSASPRVKQRALFVLAQSGSPRAKALLTDIAKGKGNPDLQMKALDYLGVFGNPDVPLLVSIYKGTADIDVKRRVIRSLAMAGGRRGMAFANIGPQIALAQEQLAKTMAGWKGELSEADKARMQADADRMRADAARAQAEAERATSELNETLEKSLGRSSADRAERQKAREAKAKEASDALWQLYQGESSVDLRREILRSMWSGNQSERLLQIAKSEKDVELRKEAIRSLMFSRTPQNADLLVGLYRDEKDPTVKRQIIDTLGMNNAAALVQIARQETDPQLRKRIVERLSLSRDKAATDYLMELLKK